MLDQKERRSKELLINIDGGQVRILQADYNGAAKGVMPKNHCALVKYCMMYGRAFEFAGISCENCSQSKSESFDRDFVNKVASELPNEGSVERAKLNGLFVVIDSNENHNNKNAGKKAEVKQSGLNGDADKKQKPKKAA